MNFNKTVSNLKRIYKCLLEAINLHAKIEEMFYKSINDDEIDANMFTNENVLKVNKEMDYVTLKLYNTNKKYKSCFKY